MADDSLKPAYLIAGEDGAKLDAALSRLRQRAEREGGMLETFESSGQAGPDVDALIGAMPAISLMSERRYLLADSVHPWRATQVKRLAEAMAGLGEDLTLVLVCRGKVPKGLAEATKKAGGDVLSYEAPGKRQLPAWVAEAARARGFEIAPQAARALVERVGEGTVRLSTELDRIALWAEPGARVEVDEVEELTADGSERKGWTLGDAIVDRDVAGAVAAADELLDQGEAVTPMIYGMATRLRAAHMAAAGLEAGRPPKEIEASLPMAPYPSKLLVKAVSGTSPAELSEAIGAIADLEWWTRGGSDYEEEVAFTLAVRRAAGAERAA
ncbi:MAG TPA: DNA polymerase III subunit delta [Solirubrobacterales bacterium]|nr:DNA polymerase III subunit delta [Solirubrobacterales bacterium]